MWNTCKERQNEIIALRRDLHRIPEVGTELPRTAAYIKAWLEQWGIGYTCSAKDSSIIATIRGGGPGKTIALRTDMDALPIEEETGLPFASEHEGRMHACGHDAHMAMLLGAAQVLQENRARLKGQIRLLFQTAEELLYGAPIMIANGALEGVDAVFGLHVGTILGPDINSGTLIAVPGCCMASSDRFILRVRGRSVHGSAPEKGVDPINIGCHIVQALQTITTREVAATDALVLTVGKFIAGSAFNIIPDQVLIEGTIRALDERVRRFAGRRIGEIAQAQAAAFGGQVDYELILGPPPVISDPDMAALAAAAGRQVLGAENVITSIAAPSMVGEDFAFFLAEVPGAYVLLSSANAAKGTDIPHHNSHFDVDEDVLWQGAAIFVNIAEKFLNQ